MPRFPNHLLRNSEGSNPRKGEYIFTFEDINVRLLSARKKILVAALCSGHKQCRKEKKGAIGEDLSEPCAPLISQVPSKTGCCKLSRETPNH